MMTVSLRAAQPSQLRSSLAAARSCLLLMLLCVFGASAFGQGLTPSTAITFGDLNLGVTGTFSQQFTGPSGGVTIQSVTAVTEGAPGEDFSVISTDCIGTITLPNTCSVNLAFKPTQIGLRLGALLVTNSAGVVVNTIYLSGVGVGPQLVLSPATAVATNSATTITPSPTSFTAGAAVQDGVGDLFFTDVTNNRILELSAAGVYSELVALPVSATSGLAIDGVGNLYVSSGNSVYTISPSATPVTATKLSITNVTLAAPTGLAVDLIGDLYIADSTNNKIYQLPLGSTSANTLTLTGASLSGPTGLAIDANSNLYIADSGNNRIVENPLGSNTANIVTLSSLTLSHPTGVAVDAAGTLYIADTGHSRVVESTVTGDQFVLTDPGLTLTTPASVLIQGSPQASPNAQYNGDLVISDTTLGLVVVERSGPIGPSPSPTITFLTPTVLGTLDTIDNPTTFLTVQETGNIVSTLTAGPDPNFTGTDPTAFLLGTSVSPAAPLCPSLGTGAAPSPADNFSIGQVCTYNVNFEPTVVGPNTANLILATSAAGGTLTAGGTATLLGTGLSTVKSFSLVATPATIFLGNSVELILTALQADGTTVATDYVGTVTFTTTDSTGKYLGGTGTGTQTSVYTLTAADKGILVIPATAGLQLNQYGIFTATATATSVPSGANPTAISNPITVIEPSTLTLTSTVNPSLVNESTTFTLTVATTGTVTPGGTVTFYNGNTVIGSAPLVTASATTATASIADSFAASGTYPIKAVYASTSNTQGGTATLTQVVGNATSLTLTSSINPSLVGQSTNLTVAITSNPVFGAITGSVQFFDGATSLGTVTVNGPTATLPISFTTAGTHTLKAVFTSTNVNITNATASPYSQQVLNVATLGLTSTVNPSLPAQSTTLTATLTALGTPTGTVKFYDGATLIGTAPLSGTTASVSVSFTSTGNHILTAVYSGDTLTQTVTSAPLTQVVLYTTTVSLTTSVNPVNVNSNTLLTAAVKSTGTVAATGTVTFKSNGVTIGTGTVNGGVATVAASFPAPGTYTLTAVYAGDANNQTATSAPIQQTVLGLVTVSLTSSVNPILLDNPTILTATLVSTGTPPTGTISFFDGNTPIGTGTIVNGTVSISASFVYAGPHTLTAAYSGDAANSPATSPGFTETAADFTLTVASGSSSIGTTIAGGTATYALVLTPIITTTLPAPVTLTVTGLPSNDTGTLTPTTIATGSGTTPVAFSVTAATIVAALHRQPRPTHRSPLGYAPVALALMVLPLAWFRRRQRFGSLLASLCLLFAFTAGLTGCISAANTGYYGQTPQTYNLTVTATSGNLTRSTYLTLTVQ